MLALLARFSLACCLAPFCSGRRNKIFFFIKDVCELTSVARSSRQAVRFYSLGRLQPQNANMFLQKSTSRQLMSIKTTNSRHKDPKK